MFPDFDDNIRKAFRKETEMFFAHILRENRSALELLSADYTFVNERLAKHYGIPGVYGSRFRQVKLDRSEPPRPAGPGQRPVADLGGDAHVAGVPRQVHPDDVPEHAAAAAAAERADARGEQQGAARRAQDGARAAGAAPQQPDLRVAATASSTRWASRSRTSTRSASGATAAPTARRWTPAASWPTARRWTARWRCATPS